METRFPFLFLARSYVGHLSRDDICNSGLVSKTAETAVFARVCLLSTRLLLPALVPHRCPKPESRGSQLCPRIVSSASSVRASTSSQRTLRCEVTEKPSLRFSRCMTCTLMSPRLSSLIRQNGLLFYVGW